MDEQLHQAALDQDRMFGSFCRQRQMPDPVFDAAFGSGPDASPWLHGPPPLWLWLTYMSHLVDVKVTSLCYGKATA